MRYFLSLLIGGLFVAVCVPTSAQPQPDKKPRLDAYGDPLPEGAVARLGTVRWRHEGPITRAVFSPDGKRIASGSGERPGDEGVVYLWDENGKQLWRATIGTAPLDDLVSCLVFSPDGKNVVAGIGTKSTTLLSSRKFGCQLVMFDVETGQVRTEFKEQDRPVLAAAFAENGKSLVSLDSTGAIRKWDVATRKVVHEWQAVETGLAGGVGFQRTTRAIDYAAISPAGDKLALQVSESEVGKSKKELRVLDTVNSKVIYSNDLGAGLGFMMPPKGAESQLVFSADGKILAVGDAEGIVFRDATTGKIETEFRQPMPYGVSFSTNGKTFALIHSELISIYDVATRKVTKEFKGPERVGRKVASALSTDGLSLLVDSDRLLSTTGVLNPFDTKTGKEQFQSTGHSRAIASLRFSKDSALLYSGQPNRLFTWDIKNWKLKDSMTSSEATKEMPNTLDSKSVGSDDYSLFLVVTRDNTLEVRERATGKIISSFGPTGPQKTLFGKTTSPTVSAFFSPSNGFVVVSESAVVNEEKNLTISLKSKPGKVINARTGKQVLSTEDPRKWRNTFSPDDTLLAVAELSGEIAVFETATGKVQHRLQPPGMGKKNSKGAMAISPDCHYLASWENQVGSICIWNLQTGKLNYEIPGKEKTPLTLALAFGSEFTLAFSPDSRLLASTHRENQNIVQVWEIATGKLRQEFKGHTGSVGSLAWSPDGRLLASGSADATVLVWDVWGSDKR